MKQQQEQVLMFDGMLAEKIGLNEAIVLQRLVYWQKRSSDSGWIYNSYKDWKKQFKFLSIRSIQRAFLSLERQGIIKCKRAKMCNFYQLKIDIFKNLLLEKNTRSDCLNKESNQINSEENYLKQMLRIWEKKIPNSGQSLSLIEERRAKLEELFAGQFKSSISEWEKFVDLITQSDFLMGKVNKFRIFLDWAIVPDNCLKILEGVYANKDAKPKAEVTSEKVKSGIKEFLSTIEDEQWKKAATSLTHILGSAEYYSWITKIKFIKHENQHIYFEAENKFIANWVQNHYSSKIEQAWQKANSEEVTVIISITSHKI